MKRQQWLAVKAEAGKSRAHGWPTMQMAQLVNSADQIEKIRRMILKLASFLKSTGAIANIVILSFATFLGAALSASEQKAGDGDVREVSSSSLSKISANIAEQYPSVRALALVQGNCVVFEYYRKDIDTETQSPVYSVTKSVLSILVGIAIDEGFLRLDEKLSEVFPEEFDEKVDPLARDITVRDLLTMTDGFEAGGWGHFKVGAGVSGKPKIWRWMLNRRVNYPGGAHFRYDGIGSDLLSVVLSTVIKQSAADFAKQKLFGPLHIDNYTWHSDTEGYLYGESGLYLTARDMAKIGILYLQNGRWGDVQVVSAAYARDSTTKHNDGGPPVKSAYGYQWWINESGTDLAAFFAAGQKSQLIYVVPKRDLVFSVAADSIPGGRQKFIDNVVLPAAIGLSEPLRCVAPGAQ
jgi:CubicO group peptidase (beta-lactamase class C family)